MGRTGGLWTITRRQCHLPLGRRGWPERKLDRIGTKTNEPQRLQYLATLGANCISMQRTTLYRATAESKRVSIFSGGRAGSMHTVGTTSGISGFGTSATCADCEFRSAYEARAGARVDAAEGPSLTQLGH